MGRNKAKEKIIVLSILFTIVTIFILYILTAMKMVYSTQLKYLSLEGKILGLINYKSYIHFPVHLFSYNNVVQKSVYQIWFFSIMVIFVLYGVLIATIINKNKWTGIEHGSSTWANKLDRVKYKLNFPFEIKYKVKPISHKLKEINSEIKKVKKRKLKEISNNLNQKKQKLLDQKKELEMIKKGKILLLELKLVKKVIKNHNKAKKLIEQINKFKIKVEKKRKTKDKKRLEKLYEEFQLIEFDLIPENQFLEYKQILKIKKMILIKEKKNILLYAVIQNEASEILKKIYRNEEIKLEIEELEDKLKLEDNTLVESYLLDLKEDLFSEEEVKKYNQIIEKLRELKKIEENIYLKEELEDEELKILLGKKYNYFFKKTNLEEEIEKEIIKQIDSIDSKKIKEEKEKLKKKKNIKNLIGEDNYKLAKEKDKKEKDKIQKQIERPFSEELSISLKGKNYMNYYYKNYNNKNLPPLDEIEFVRNIILSNTEFLPVNDRAIFRTLNIMVVGGSGAGKSRYFVKPNILLGSMNMVVTDPKGELYEDTHETLRKQGYKIKVLNLKEFEKSTRYNPFKYIRTETDVPVIVETLLNKGKDAKLDFWESSAKELFTGLVYYYYEDYKARRKINPNCKLPTIYELLNNISELMYDEERDEKSEFYKTIENLPEEHPAKIYFKEYLKGSEKTNSGIRKTLTTNLSYLAAPNIKKLTLEDDFDLDAVDEKSIIYVIMSDSNKAYNSLASLFFSQLFQVLYYNADKRSDKRLPIPCQFFLDEFANIGQINNFSEILATCRGRRIGIAIIVQALAQLEHLYEKNSSTIIGNCDTFLYLGGNDLETMEKLSKAIGKTTVDTERTGRSRTYGSRGSNSKSDNVNAVGRELISVDELSRLEDTKCIIRIRGFKPFKSDKLDIDKFYNDLAVMQRVTKEFLTEKKLREVKRIKKIKTEDKNDFNKKNIQTEDKNELEVENNNLYEVSLERENQILEEESKLIEKELIEEKEEIISEEIEKQMDEEKIQLEENELDEQEMNDDECLQEKLEEEIKEEIKDEELDVYKKEEKSKSVFGFDIEM